MKKKFKLQDLDCANCAAKMEEAIKKIDGVNDASVNFMMQKMTIDADDSKFDDIMKEVVTVCAKVDARTAKFFCNRIDPGQLTRVFSFKHTRKEG